MLLSLSKYRFTNLTAFFVLLGMAGGCAPPVVAGAGAGAGTGAGDHGHDHAHEPEPVAITVFTDKVELFMEYPRLIPGHKARFLAHVTVSATGEPVRSGSLQLVISQASVTTHTLDVPRPKRDGLFIPVGTFDTPGEYEARIVVTSEQVQDAIALPNFVVHADQAAAFAAAAAEAQADPADAVPFLLETQWKIGMLMQVVERRPMVQSLQAAGVVEAPQSAMAVVSAPFAGRLLPLEAGRLPQLGDHVGQGQMLGWIEPALSYSDRAQELANETSQDSLAMEHMLREYDLQTKRVGNRRDISMATTNLRFAKQALERISTLLEKDLGLVSDLEEAQRNLAHAQNELTSMNELAKAYAASSAQLEKLKASMEQSRGAMADGTYGRVEVLAPISGEIVEVNYVNGEHVADQAPVYRVLDLNRVWIAAQVSEFDLDQVAADANAQLHFSTGPKQGVDIFNDAGGRIVHMGRSVDPDSRTVSLRYELPNPDGQLRVGMFVDLMIETGRAPQAVAIPEASVVMDNGGPVAFVLVNGEMFQKRMLKLGIRHRGFVEVLSGIETGDRVVTHGAYLVKLASASPASFGAGHAH